MGVLEKVRSFVSRMIFNLVLITLYATWQIADIESEQNNTIGTLRYD